MNACGMSETTDGWRYQSSVKQSMPAVSTSNLLPYLSAVAWINHHNLMATAEPCTMEETILNADQAVQPLLQDLDQLQPHTIERWDSGQPAPRSASPEYRSSYFHFKYAADRLVGTGLLIICAPLIALLWIAVKLTSRGPGLYFQTRVGLQGEPFRVVKLRTMGIDAEDGDNVQWCQRKDPRITPLGKILRKTHLDELPQLWNVARGEMCLVGPRPERPEITKSLEKLIPDYHLRHSVKPGVTGLAQVNLEPDTNLNITRRKQILDLRYIDNANLFLDARMLIATSLKMLFLSGASTIRLTGLKQTITDAELRAIGYEFGTAEDELWNPSKGHPELRLASFHRQPPATQTREHSNS